MTQAALYYEAHVTIEPVFDIRLEMADIIARRHRFKVADLLMQKRREDTPERSSKDTFMTGHGQDLEEITERLTNLVTELKSRGFKVWRYKVEDTVFDSRNQDVLGLLEGVAA